VPTFFWVLLIQAPPIQDDTAAAVTRLEICLDDVSHWMAANRLELNAEKTELLWAPLGSNGLLVQFDTKVISASDHVRVLGVTISSDLFLDKHVANVCSSGFYWLRKLRRVSSLDMDSIKTLVHGFVMSRVDYCNAFSPDHQDTLLTSCSVY